MSIDLLTRLKELRLYGMAETWAEVKAEEPQRQQALSAEQVMRQLIDAEITDRQTRSLNDQLKVAKFPIHRDLVNFSWDETPLSRLQIEQLSTAKFMDESYSQIWCTASQAASCS